MVTFIDSNVYVLIKQVGWGQLQRRAGGCIDRAKECRRRGVAAVYGARKDDLWWPVVDCCELRWTTVP